MSDELKHRQAYSRAKILEGWQRLADSTEIDWTFDTAETLAAEDRVAEVKAKYDRGETSIDDLRYEFGEWAKAQRNKQRQSDLFVGAK